MSFKFPYLLVRSLFICTVQFVLMFARDNGRENGRTDFLGMISFGFFYSVCFFLASFKKRERAFVEWASDRAYALWCAPFAETEMATSFCFYLSKWCIELHAIHLFFLNIWFVGTLNVDLERTHSHTQDTLYYSNILILSTMSNDDDDDDDDVIVVELFQNSLSKNSKKK